MLHKNNDVRWQIQQQQKQRPLAFADALCVTNYMAAIPEWAVMQQTRYEEEATLPQGVTSIRARLRVQTSKRCQANRLRLCHPTISQCAAALQS